MEQFAKKSLGQHWLNDTPTLISIVESAQLGPEDTVLEIGPGQGSLTSHLVKAAKKVIAIEKDENLVSLLRAKNLPNLEILEGDILKFDFGALPKDYKIVANIPYYLTAHLLRLLGETSNPPALVVLLVQKEVAERVCAKPGQMSNLAVATQLSYIPSLGDVVPARLFEPPPKVDSQVLILKRRQEPIFPGLDHTKYMRIVKSGFASKRKKLRSSLAAGLQLSREQADGLLEGSGISGDLRPQNLSLQDWHKIYVNFP